MNVTDEITLLLQAATEWAKKTPANFLWHSGIDAESQIDYIFEPLTRCEHQVLVLVAKGLSNVGIADALSKTEGCVKGQIRMICAKFNIPNDPDTAKKINKRVLVVEIGRRLGWVSPPESVAA